MSEALLVEQVSAAYGPTSVLHDLTLAVKAGELVSLLGSSGCGKTTTLRLIAGFLQPTAGRIQLGDRDVTRLPSHRRNIGLVFQNYALFPHLTARDNVAFGLKQRSVPVTEGRRRATQMLDRVGLGALADRLPAALSGGQKQRVALARALVIEPPLLMLDEPLSNLDAKLRVAMRAEIRELQRQNGTTAVFVTHDQEEAFSISDRVAIMDAGRIVQFDIPEILYRRPVDAFVARFVGFENMMALRVFARTGEDVTAVSASGARFCLPRSALGDIPDEFVLAARAEGLHVGPAPGGELQGTVLLRTYLGHAYQYKVQTGAGVLFGNGPLGAPLAPGDAAGIRVVPSNCCVLPRASRGRAT